MDMESILISAAVLAVLGVSYRLMRRGRKPGESSTEHFFGSMDDDTAMADVGGPKEPPSR